MRSGRGSAAISRGIVSRRCPSIRAGLATAASAAGSSGGTCCGVTYKKTSPEEDVFVFVLKQIDYGLLEVEELLLPLLLLPAFCVLLTLLVLALLL